LIPADDGLIFDVDSVEGEEIRAAGEFAGVRVRLIARQIGHIVPERTCCDCVGSEEMPIFLRINRGTGTDYRVQLAAIRATMLSQNSAVTNAPQ